MKTTSVDGNAREPIPRQPVPERAEVGLRWVGVLVLPLAVPYRPLAHLYAGPDGALWWTVRLWREGGAVDEVVPTSTILAFARINGLARVAAEVHALVARVRTGAAP